MVIKGEEILNEELVMQAVEFYENEIIKEEKYKEMLKAEETIIKNEFKNLNKKMLMELEKTINEKIAYVGEYFYRKGLADKSKIGL